MIAHHRNLIFSFSQGFVSGQLLFSLYTTPLSNITDIYGNVTYIHLYAGDTAFSLFILQTRFQLTKKLTGRVTDVQNFSNKLKLNHDRTEFILFG